MTETMLFETSPFPTHSKLRLIYPMPKIQKNYTRLDIKTEGSLICIKAREAKKMGSCLASKGLNGQKPTWVYGKETQRGWL